MTGYELGKEIQKILGRLERLEARLKGTGSDNKSSYHDDPSEVIAGSIDVTVHGSDGFSTNPGDRRVPITNATNSPITINAGAISASVATNETVQCMLAGGGLSFDVTYRYQFVRHHGPGSIGDGWDETIDGVGHQSPQGIGEGDSQAGGPIVVQGRGVLNHNGHSLFLN
jgi:hypothetical protein